MHTFDIAFESPDGQIVIGGRNFLNRASFERYFAKMLDLEELACFDFRKGRRGGMTFQVEATCVRGTCATCR